jgi:hypothetical protein
MPKIMEIFNKKKKNKTKDLPDDIIFLKWCEKIWRKMSKTDEKQKTSYFFY